jgi:hypothetical protein
LLTSDHRRYTETVLPPNETVSVFGAATPKPVESSGADDALEITNDNVSGRFIVSDRSATELTAHYDRWAPITMVGGPVVSAGCLFFLPKLFGL